jgi:adenylate kinase
MDENAVIDVSIIDGGFVHNSPIEAAVKLEATHIIMIEASPEYAVHRRESSK